jgi:hypothetical protein
MALRASPSSVSAILRAGAKPLTEPERCVGVDAPLALQNLRHAVDRYADGPGLPSPQSRSVRRTGSRPDEWQVHLASQSSPSGNPLISTLDGPGAQAGHSKQIRHCSDADTKLAGAIAAQRLQPIPRKACSAWRWCARCSDAGHASGRILRPVGQTAGHQAGITRVVVCVPRRLVSRDPCALQAKIAALSGPRVAIHHGLHRLLPGPPCQR